MHRTLAQALADGWKPPSTDPIEVWMEKHVPLDRTSAMSGKWRRSVTPWAVQGIRDFAHPLVRDITTVGPSQGAKTTPPLGCMAWLTVNAPGPCLFISADAKLAKEVSKERLGPILRKCKPTSALFTEDRFDASTWVTRLTSCTIEVCTAKSENAIEGRPFRYIFADECRKWDKGALQQLEKRTRTYPNGKRWKFSTPNETGSEFHESYLASNQQELFVACMGCGQEFHLSPPKAWDSLMRWDKNEITCPGGVWNADAVAQNLGLECPHCKHRHLDRPEVRRYLANHSFYKPLNPAAPVSRAGQRFNAFIPTWIRWIDLWTDFHQAIKLAALGNLEPLKIFVTESMAEWWDEKEQTTYEVKERPKASYNFADATAQAFDFRILTIDVQAKEFWAVARGWNRTGASRLLFAGNPLTWGECEEIRGAHGVEARKTLVDSGFDATTVYRQAIRWGWVCLKGEDKTHFLHRLKGGKAVRRIYSEAGRGDPGIGTSEQGRKFAPLILFSTPVCQDILQRLIDGQGAPWEVAGDAPDFYWKQVHSWVKKPKKNRETGVEELRWVQVRQQDHLRACEVMQIAAASILGVFASDKPETPPPSEP